MTALGMRSLTLLHLSEGRSSMLPTEGLSGGKSLSINLVLFPLTLPSLNAYYDLLTFSTATEESLRSFSLISVNFE